MLFDLDNWREIGATLARNKTRTFLTAFGIFWGTAMLALLMGGAQGLEGALRANFEGFATNSGVIFPDRTTMPYKGYQKGMKWTMTTTDVENIRRIVPELEAVSPIVQTSSTIKHKDKTYSATLQGLESNYVKVLNPVILNGRFISEADDSRSLKVCVLGKNAASSLFGADDPIGQYVEVDNVYYRVVGVVKQQAEVSIGARLDNSMVIPLSTARRTYNLGQDVHFLMIVAKDGHTPTELRPAIYRALRISHPLHPNDDGNMFFMDVSEIFQQVNLIFVALSVLILFVGLSSLIAGIIGVGNIMWIIVKERTKEFGIRRAIGARPREIMQQILLESAVLTSLAGTSGICFAVGVLALADHIMHLQGDMSPQTHFQLTFWGAVAIMALFLILGSAAGSIPALKAMKIKPIEALNDK